MDKERKYTELSTVNSQRNEIIPEEFPEGPYGSPMNYELSQEWEAGEHAISNLAYEHRKLHENIPRQDPASHHTNDDPEQDSEPL